MRLKYLLISCLILYSNFSYSNATNNIGTIKLYTQEFPPYTYLENNAPAGFGVEVVIAACEAANLSCLIKLDLWNRAQFIVKKGEAHGLFLAAANKAREDLFYFSEPIIQARYSFFVLNEHATNYKKLDDFSGKLIGAYGPSNTYTSLLKLNEILQAKNIKTFTPDLYYDNEAQLKKLRLQRLDAWYTNAAVGHYLINKTKAKEVIEILPAEDFTYHVLFNKSNVDLSIFQAFNLGLAKIIKQGTMTALMQQYKIN